MIAIQFQTVNEPQVRDTRDTWELREHLLKEKELELQLINEIRSMESKIDEYKYDPSRSKEETLKATLQELKEEVGLTKKKGYGITLVIEPIQANYLVEEDKGRVSADLLNRLVNELHLYGAKDLSIGGQRYISTSVIREINSQLKVNGYTLNPFSLEIIALAKDKESAERLNNYMKVSKATDEFFLDSLELSISFSKKQLTIPAYEKSIVIHNMEPVVEEGGGS